MKKIVEIVKTRDNKVWYRYSDSSFAIFYTSKENFLKLVSKLEQSDMDIVDTS